MVRRMFAFILILALFLSASAPILAQAKESPPTGENKDAAHKPKAQQNPFDPPRFDLMLWTIAVFVLLLLVLRKFAWKPMLSGLQKREETIRNALAEAQRAQEEAKRLRDQFQAEINRSHEKARDILDEARKDAQRTTDEMVAKARSEIQGERERVRREIETAKDQALQELWNQTAEVASLVSSKAIRRHLSIEDHRNLVDEALVEFHQAGQERRRRA